MGILDYFTPEARRGNREWLDSQNAAIAEALRYYLGPTGIPDRLGLLAESTPTAGLERAGTESSRMFAPGLSGWDRMAAAGNMLSETAGAGAGLLGMPAAGRLADDLVEAAAPAVRRFGAGDEGGLKLYHGSPHDFDKFSMDKIGTGEGAQAYGHGLYFAENEGIAKAYRDELSGNNIEARNFFKDGAIVPDIGNVWQGGYDAAKAAADIRPDAARAIAGQVQDWVASGKKAETFLRYNQPPAGYEAAYKAAADAWSGVSYKKNPGSMYEVQINADPEAFLDWDMPLAGQAPEIQKAVRMFAPRAPGMASGRKLLNEIGGDVPNPQGFNADRAMVAASDKLREAGVPGIRYLDAGSRSTGGTRNYVIFDENLISIVRKYGIAGAAAMLGMSQADVAQAMGQQPQGLLESGPQ